MGLLIIKSRVILKLWKEHYQKKAGDRVRGVYKTKIEPNLSKISTLALCGKGEKEIALFLGVALKTLKKYKKLYPELQSALDEKKNSDALIMKAFFKRACGYTVEEESCEFKSKKNSDGELEDEQVIKKTVKKDVPPDLNAIKWWIENNGEKPIEEAGIDLTEARELLLARERLERE